MLMQYNTGLWQGGGGGVFLLLMNFLIGFFPSNLDSELDGCKQIIEDLDFSIDDKPWLSG